MISSTVYGGRITFHPGAGVVYAGHSKGESDMLAASSFETPAHFELMSSVDFSKVDSLLRM